MKLFYLQLITYCSVRLTDTSMKSVPDIILSISDLALAKFSTEYDMEITPQMIDKCSYAGCSWD